MSKLQPRKGRNRRQGQYRKQNPGHEGGEITKHLLNPHKNPGCLNVLGRDSPRLHRPFNRCVEQCRDHTDRRKDSKSGGGLVSEQIGHALHRSLCLGTAAVQWPAFNVNVANAQGRPDDGLNKRTKAGPERIAAATSGNPVSLDAESSDPPPCCRLTL